MQEAQRDAERADMRAAKLDWMQRQKEAFRNRQQVTHLAVTCVELPGYRSAEAVCGERPSGSASGSNLAGSAPVG